MLHILSASAALSLSTFALAQQPGPTGPVGPAGPAGISAVPPDEWSRIVTTFGGPTVVIGGAAFLLKAAAKFLGEQREASLAHDKQRSDLQTAVFNAQISGLQALAQAQKDCVVGLQTASTTQLAVVTQCRELLREAQLHADTHKP